jgi:acyl-CoA thioesterase FadM
VELWVSRFGGASYDVTYNILNEAGELCAKAKSVMVTVDVTSGSAIRIPDDVRNALSRFAEDAD